MTAARCSPTNDPKNGCASTCLYAAASTPACRVMAKCCTSPHVPAHLVPHMDNGAGISSARCAYSTAQGVVRHKDWMCAANFVCDGAARGHPAASAALHLALHFAGRFKSPLMHGRVMIPLQPSRTILCFCSLPAHSGRSQ